MILLQNIINSNYHYQPSWVMIIIVLSVMIFGYLFSAFSSRFNSFVQSALSMRLGGHFSRSEYSLTHPLSIFLSANFIITASLFVLQLFSSRQLFFEYFDFSFLSFLLIAAILLAIYAIKIICIQFLGHILDNYSLTIEYTTIVFLTNQIIGIGFIPVIIFIAYGQQTLADTVINIGLGLMAFSFILRVGKGAVAALSYRNSSLFYLFLYLCTLEILPLLLGWKLLQSWM